MWYKFKGEWVEENELQDMYETFCIGFNTGGGFWGAKNPTFGFFVKELKRREIISNEKKEMCIVDLLKNNEYVKATKLYRKIHGLDSLFQAKKIVDEIESDMYTYSNGKFGRKKLEL